MAQVTARVGVRTASKKKVQNTSWYLVYFISTSLGLLHICITRILLVYLVYFFIRFEWVAVRNFSCAFAILLVVAPLQCTRNAENSIWMSLGGQHNY